MAAAVTGDARGAVSTTATGTVAALCTEWAYDFVFSCDGVAGSETVNVLPLPGLLVQGMLPPCRSTMDLVMESPRPTPGIAAWRAAPVRKKRVKIFDVSSVVIPMPVS